MPSPARVLVTGARGFIGAAVTRELLRRYPGTEVVAVSRRQPDSGDHPGPALDLTDADAWRELDGPYDWIVHLAAEIPSGGGALDDERTYRANLLPCLHLSEGCKRWRSSRLVYVSSISVYPMGAAPTLHESLVPRPTSFYGAAKLAGEHLLAQSAGVGTGVIALRLSSVYGFGQRQRTVLPLFVETAAAQRPIQLVAGGGRTQDFLHVSDAARGIVDAAASEATGVYNLASGVATSMVELARVVTAFPGWSVAIVDRGGVDTGPSVTVDISKAREGWGFRAAVALSDGIGQYRAALLAASSRA